MFLDRRLLAIALASALSLPAAAQNPPPPQPAPQPAPQAKDAPDKSQLEQDALDPAGLDPARADAQTAKGRTAPGAAKEEPKWDVNAAHGPTKTVRFATDEGTWMDVDVSPDGREIAFALLGDLYRLPIGGGAATRVTS
ncbi:MAG: DPP IV N-terminal domain-containing protein, partial [Pseudomonas sp.]|nr:DPP IV N-terminal domain-containing protein [Pseudomonas sp.]